MFQGYLKVRLLTADGAVPVSGQSVYIKVPGNTDYTVSDTAYDYRLTTDLSGTTGHVSIEAPDPSAALNEYNYTVPYSTADVYVNVPGYFPVRILNAQIFAGNLSTLPILLTPISAGYADTDRGTIVYSIPPNALLTPTPRDPSSIPGETAEPQVLESVVIPEYVSVHLGTPASSAENVYVPFADYIKNVASSEIYPTWSEETIRANVLAIVSLTLNRIFSEWYPSKGYNFDITNSTAFDQSFVPGRNIFDSISGIVDEIFDTYIVKAEVISPLFAAYCDGRTVFCNGLSQWGSEELGRQGYSALNILKYYYGNDIELRTAGQISGAPSSYPGSPLSLGAEGEAVEMLRRMLYRISLNYPLIPRINPLLETFDSALDSAVRTFQEIFGLTVDGIVGKATWYRISQIYSSVTKLAELSGSEETGGLPAEPPTETVRGGDTGIAVARLQLILGYLSLFYPQITTTALDGIFGQVTETAVREFQSLFGLPVTGSVTASDWVKLYDVYENVLELITPALGEQSYPGTPLSTGSRGESVLLIQNYLNTIADTYPAIPKINADGVFGPATAEAVRAFQRRFFIEPTGRIDFETWGQIVEIYNFVSER